MAEGGLVEERLKVASSYGERTFHLYKFYVFEAEQNIMYVFKIIFLHQFMFYSLLI